MQPRHLYTLLKTLYATFMQTYRKRFDYPDFADEAPKGFSHLPRVIISAGEGTWVRLTLKLTLSSRPEKDLGNKQSLPLQ